MMNNKVDDVTVNNVPSMPTRQSGFFDRWQGLPLLRKDLHELSTRRRTYIERVAYVAGLMLICYLTLPISLLTASTSRLDLLGLGGRFFVTIVWIQKVGLFLALPALTCSSITQERQRGTLDLLRITSLSPTSIILEKFLSRFALALNFVLISSPVVAFCYPLGGVSAVDIVQSLVDLMLLSVCLTAMGVMFSAIRATAQQALIATYFWYLAVGFLIHMILFGSLSTLNPKVAFEFLGLYWLGSQGCSILVAAVCLDRGRTGLQKVPARLNTATASPSALSARSEFRTRRTTDELDFLADAPITWRIQLNRANRTQPDLEMLPELILLFVPAFAIGILASTGGVWFPLKFWAFGTIIWTLALCIRESGKIALERTKQTLSVLLTTPLSGSEIVRQNQFNSFGALRSWQLTSAGWLAGIMVLNFHFIVLIQGVLAICIYPLIVKWQISVCDLTSKNENQATLKSLLMLTIRFTGPLVAVGLLGTTISGLWGAAAFRNSAAIAYAISPLFLFGELLPDSNSQLAMLIVSMIANCGIAFYLRHKATVDADYYLGRVTSSSR
jgi:hypothetical protein